MKSWLKVSLLAVVAGSVLVLGNTRPAEAGRYVFRSYYAGPYYAGTAVEYRRPFTPFYAPRTVYYAPAAVYAAPVYPVYGAPGYGGPVYGAPVYEAVPTVTNYPGGYHYYRAPVRALPAPAVVYPLPSLVYPPAVFP